MASVARLVGDLATAEDAVQDACLVALTRWPVEGQPDNPRAWLIGTARHKALDQVRREARRGLKEAAAVRDIGMPGPPESAGAVPDEQLGLIFMCCHPAFDPPTRVALT
ncbi:MAG TPA: sigma factor, partial [Pseudonocardiaceae bacterium]